MIASVTGSAEFLDRTGYIDVGELIQFTSVTVEKQTGFQRPTFPRIEGGEGFRLAAVPTSSEGR